MLRVSQFCAGGLSFSCRNISNQGKDSKEFFGRVHTSQHAEMFQHLKLAASHTVSGEQLLVRDKPSPRGSRVQATRPLARRGCSIVCVEMGASAKRDHLFAEMSRLIARRPNGRISRHHVARKK